MLIPEEGNLFWHEKYLQDSFYVEEISPYVIPNSQEV